jgi:hypothetical protein
MNSEITTPTTDELIEQLFSSGKIKISNTPLAPFENDLSGVFALRVQALPGGRFDPPNAAGYLGCSPKTLANHRVNGTGPRFIKTMGRIYYTKADLDEFIAQGAGVRSTAEARTRVKPVRQ